MTIQHPALPDSQQTLSWWQVQPLSHSEVHHFSIGPLSVYIQRQADEWLLASRTLASTGESSAVDTERLQELPPELEVTRYVFKQAPQQFQLKPKSLDRPVVVKTENPVQVPPGESVTFFISSPICISVDLPELALTLQEFPTQQLSDTWFGPSTQVGTLCYAARTHARNNRQDVPLRAHRAVTPVTVNNQTSSFLAIKKLSIPVPLLAIYGTQEGTLWTDPVVLTQVQNEPMISLAIDKTPPTGELISASRESSTKNGLLRAFSNIFAIS